MISPRTIAKTLSLAALVACDAIDTSGTTRPEPSAPSTETVSEASQSLRNYYVHVQQDLQARGLLRIDGGGPDTPFTADMLARNFERIAFFEEYARDSGFSRKGQASDLRRWDKPVRVSLEFGPSVSEVNKAKDRETLNSLVPRLAKATGHKISQSAARANFHVLVMGYDDRDALETRVAQLLPNASTTTRNLFLNLPRDLYCFVVAFPDAENSSTYGKAVAFVRAEHPDLLRKSCFHEEVAQGLGLANDSPSARPSIFNDDDEFALLTTHDEMLLSMLYDARLSPGMTVDEARPIIYILAREQTGRIY
ncbi:Protein of unknown function (DUF2927) [Shimia isoporae]|uniref:DUF2927 family protein n=1 Tax=Shimia isoporae TaxID=647720 RepID=A0A4R1N106_9RHOB|nr:DUF2927 domain-containing protein [Shimia isoporae]TCK99384.1 Protein of unknown function (DUF2927) [Shimia isoporae]